LSFLKAKNKILTRKAAVNDARLMASHWRSRGSNVATI